MSERKQGSGSPSARLGFRYAFLVVIAAFCSFAAPYLVYALSSHVFKVDWLVSVAAGFALFAVGVVLIIILINKKVIV